MSRGRVPDFAHPNDPLEPVRRLLNDFVDSGYDLDDPKDRAWLDGILVKVPQRGPLPDFANVSGHSGSGTGIRGRTVAEVQGRMARAAVRLTYLPIAEQNLTVAIQAWGSGTGYQDPVMGRLIKRRTAIRKRIERVRQWILRAESAFLEVGRRVGT